MNTLPPFYVGQRVVAVSSQQFGGVVKGQQYTIDNIFQTECGWHVTVGLPVPKGYTTVFFECRNGHHHENPTGQVVVRASRFAPIQTDFQEITYQQVMENESSLINCN